MHRRRLKGTDQFFKFFERSCVGLGRPDQKEGCVFGRNKLGGYAKLGSAANEYLLKPDLPPYLRRMRSLSNSVLQALFSGSHIHVCCRSGFFVIDRGTECGVVSALLYRRRRLEVLRRHRSWNDWWVLLGLRATRLGWFYLALSVQERCLAPTCLHHQNSRRACDLQSCKRPRTTRPLVERRGQENLEFCLRRDAST